MALFTSFQQFTFTASDITSATALFVILIKSLQLVSALSINTISHSSISIVDNHHQSRTRDKMKMLQLNAARILNETPGQNRLVLDVGRDSNGNKVESSLNHVQEWVSASFLSQDLANPSISLCIVGEFVSAPLVKQDTGYMDRDWKDWVAQHGDASEELEDTEDLYITDENSNEVRISATTNVLRMVSNKTPKKNRFVQKMEAMTWHEWLKTAKHIADFIKSSPQLEEVM